MKRTEKIALLAKIVQGKASKGVIEQLRRSEDSTGSIIIYQPEAGSADGDDIISFYCNGQKLKMPFRDIETFNSNETIIFLPDNGRLCRINEVVIS